MKSELRKQVLHEMKAISQEQKQAIDQALTERLLHHPFYQEAKVIA
ncbi:TPA: 5-formyltetrahydrofolate cyclo-ligase, partial [Streptococcus pneumoniae]